MVEPTAGSILLDGVDIATLGLRQLRSVMSIIPQDPFMFSGSVRTNLDPFGQYDEADLWRVLGDVGLTPTINGLPERLDAPVVDGGNNFSQVRRRRRCCGARLRGAGAGGGARVFALTRPPGVHG